MRRGGREATDLRVRGMKLGARFVLSTSIALTLVMGLAGLVLYVGTTNIAENRRVDAISRAVRLTLEAPEYETAPTGSEHGETGVEMFPITYGAGGREGTLFRYERPVRDPESAEEIQDLRLLVPGEDDLGRDMLGMIVGILIVVVLAGAGVALWVAKQVSAPIQRLVEDVRQIAKGDLAHKTRAVGVGEVELLARSIDRMTRELQEAQETEVELSVREREMDVATGVREALLPLGTPLVRGYDLGALHLSSTRLGGDFHDFIEPGDGRVGVLVCDVSGRGVPAALVGATARAYLRTELERGEDVLGTLRRVNRWLAGDVRRGMFVTALYVLLDPPSGRAQVASAGHKLPLLRYTASDGKLRLVHPDGIALGFDKGAVFDRRLECHDVPIEPGDRLFLSNSAPVATRNAAGRELGEKALYARVLKHAPLDTTRFLRALRRDLEQFWGGESVPADVSLVTISREG